MSMKHKQKGAGLLEVLIAVLVLAVGLLGFAGMQAQAMRANFETLQKAKANMYASDMFDRIRSNLAYATSSEAYIYDFEADRPAIGEDCKAEQCSVSDLAAWDINNWLDFIEDDTNGTAKAAILRPNDADTRYFRISIQLLEGNQLKSDDNTVVDDISSSVIYDFYAIL